MKKAIIIVDVQNDFCPGGSLAVKNGDRIVSKINEYIGMYKASGDLIVYTADAHTPDHSSFEHHGGIWPPHCIKGTDGFKLHPRLVNDMDSQMFYKGEAQDQDSYSGFGNPALEAFLRANDVERVLVVGLALDYCVKATALDAKKLGFNVGVDLSCTEAVNVNEGDALKAIEELDNAGVLVFGGEDA